MVWHLSDPRDEETQDFAKSLGCVWIGMIPVRPEVFAVELCCHLNVGLMVRNVGGDKVLGYYFVDDLATGEKQAVLHSVWRSIDGDLVDITPFGDDRSINCFGYFPDQSDGLPRLVGVSRHFP